MLHGEISPVWPEVPHKTLQYTAWAAGLVAMCVCDMPVTIVSSFRMTKLIKAQRCKEPTRCNNFFVY